MSAAPAKPDGYAVVMEDGNYVGAWKSREIAESVCAKQPPSHKDRVVPIFHGGTSAPSSIEPFGEIDFDLSLEPVKRSIASFGDWLDECRLDGWSRRHIMDFVTEQYRLIEKLEKSAPSASGPSQDCVDAQECCVDIFKDFTAHEVRNESTSVRRAWQVGEVILNRVDSREVKP